MKNKMQIKTIGEPILRDICAPVTDIDAARKILADMELCMIAATGAGLAAPQVGVPLRMFIIRTEPTEDSEIIKMINPEILKKSDTRVPHEEGCLSILGPDDYPVFCDVMRPEKITVTWFDETGAAHKREFDGFAARVIQHEMDHLDGVLFVDHLSSLNRERVMSKVRKRKA